MSKFIKETVKDLGGVLLQVCALTIIYFQSNNETLKNTVKVMWIFAFLLSLFAVYVNYRKYKKI